MDKKETSYKSRPSSSKESGINCVICFKTQSISSIGACDHPVCYECSTTMRVLCDQKECPICRRIITKVIFTKEVDLFKNLDSRQYSRYNKKYGIAFNDHSVEYSFEQLMRCYCKKCYDRPDFAVFEQLATHMERNHRLYACRLCVKHLKIFPSQRRWYNYDELARHEESGDPDNTSHRGHPECHFCSIRYLDKDELYKHLRKEHFYCHFCDADGIQDYYMTYEWLRKHYHDKHFLCEEGNCINEQFTSVFRSSIDLQAHRAQTHSKELGKQGHKEARTLRLEFNFRPRHNPIVEPGRPTQYQPPPDYSYNSVHQSDRTINVRDTSDFPSLNGQHTTVLPCARTRKQNQSVNTQDLSSFPALGREQQPALPVKPQSKPTNNIQMAAVVLKKAPEPPKPEKNNKDTPGSRLPNQAKDFPSLDGNQQQTSKNNEVTASANSSGSWVSKAKTANEKNLDEKKKGKKEQSATKKKIAEAPKIPGPSDFPNLNKKLEPTKSNLAKLGNKKKTENMKKNAPSDNHYCSNNNLNVKKNVAQVGSENSKKSTENVKSTVDNNKHIDNKENNKSKTKFAETTQCNGDGNVTKPPTTAKTIVKMESNTEPKKELPKKNKDNNRPTPVKQEETTTDSANNNQKDKKKRKKNENKEPSAVTMTNSIKQSHENNNNCYDNSVKVTPKIPPGFENQSFHQNHSNHNMAVVRAPPGLTSGGSGAGLLQTTRIKAPPGLSLTAPSSKPTQEYTHPVGTTFRNQVLINNLMEALIPVHDGRIDTFEKFKEMSTLFRKHLITAYDFYSYCVEALCPRSFEAVFLELVLLLPDIQKQQQLLFIYNRNNREEMNVEICKYCSQVLRTIDMEHHMSVHTNVDS